MFCLILTFGNLAGRSDWDDGRWEWEDTPRREGYSNSSKRYQPSPSPMFVGASPDARLVSPLSTPRSNGILGAHEIFILDLKLHV